MTEKEALKKRILIKKHGIKQKLHKYNPDKYPDPGYKYSASEIIEVEMAIAFSSEKVDKLFNRDDLFFEILNKEKK